MNILIIGQGGREHALAWKISQSPEVENIYIAPGNPGTAQEPKCKNITITVDDIPALLKFAQTHLIDLTIVGPELPLTLGIVDEFTQHGLKCFGATQAASQLESSKTFCKKFAEKYQIPTAKAASFTDIEKARYYAQNHPLPFVIKADGLAAGKGVVIIDNYSQAMQTIDAMLGDKQFGKASQKIIIETFLAGEEVSYFVIADGENFLTLATAQDHKARDNGDKGPNTGGMGAFSPAPLVDNLLEQKIIDRIIQPTITGMQQENIPYTGFLFAGIMVVKGEPYLLEYNCRLGDPETQAILLRLKSDLISIILAALNKSLTSVNPVWLSDVALNVVMCAAGYPENYEKGKIINGLDDAHADFAFKIFHAGTQKVNGKILTQGGRVLSIASFGKNVAIAQKNAYHIVNQINFSGALFRTDIGYKAISATD
ncbi:MAG: phosphoribosylamine--glycine ligase [Legionellales bacterium]|nr:phosphoribosylamine--glycine ligase [Legionellales bacterium]